MTASASVPKRFRVSSILSTPPSVPAAARVWGSVSACPSFVSTAGSSKPKRFGFDDPAVLTNDGHADTEPQTRAAAGTLGGVERIEETRKRFGTDADAVILKRDANAVAGARWANLQAAGVADFANGLLGVGDEVQEHLNELVGVTNDSRKSGIRAKVHFDVVPAQGVFMQLERALDKIVGVEKLLERRRGT